MKNEVFKDGWHLPFTADAAYTSGDPVKVGSLVGIACNDYALNDVGVVCVHGVFSVPKEAEAIDLGSALYFKASTKTLTASSQGNTFAGYCWTAALLADANVDLKLLW